VREQAAREGAVWGVMSCTEGEMEKKGEHMGAGWKTRYFRLEGDKLRYYESQQDREPKGEIDLSTGPSIKEAVLLSSTAQLANFSVLPTSR
jgi:hypothetical protein